MNDYKLTLEMTVKMDDAEAADDLGEALCNIVDAILNHHPTVRRYDGIIKYDLSDKGKEASFTTSVSEYGNSLAVNITRHAEEIGVGKGDKVVVTVRRYA